MLLAVLRMSGVEQRNSRAAAVLLLNKKREWKQRMKREQQEEMERTERIKTKSKAKHDRHRKGFLS